LARTIDKLNWMSGLPGKIFRVHVRPVNGGYSFFLFGEAESDADISDDSFARTRMCAPPLPLCQTAYLVSQKNSLLHVGEAVLLQPLISKSPDSKYGLKKLTVPIGGGRLPAPTPALDPALASSVRHITKIE
jgi:hypothetical protein